MQRVVGGVALLALVLAGLIAFKLYQQDLALHGPSTGSAIVEGTAHDLTTRIAARVVAHAVERGAAVAEGDVILTLGAGDIYRLARQLAGVDP